MAKRLLLTDDHELFRTAQEAVEALSWRIDHHRRLERVPLVEAVQAFVFRVCLKNFFPDLPSPSEADAISITRDINIQWIGSKDLKMQSSPRQMRSRKSLESALKTVFQLTKTSPCCIIVLTP